MAVILGVLLALVLPAAHHRETRSESCHLCGNRRVIVRDYRWWQLSSETSEFATAFPMPHHHDHNWWLYGSTYDSYFQKWAADNSNRYRDGQAKWAP